MLGALIGDCVGSFWEFSGNKDPAIPLWMPAAHFTDDSVCTVAIARWLLGEKDLQTGLHELARIHVGAGFGGKMLQWIMSDAPAPYGSWGNGSAMRVAPIALLAANEAELLDLAAQSAAVTHNHAEAGRGAQATAWAIRQAFIHRDPGRLEREVEGRFNYPLAGRDLEAERGPHLYDVSCKGTVPLAVLMATRSGSFDETLRLCCSFGGDSDTLAAIAGPIAEALYGIPLQHAENARLRFRAEFDLWETIERLYAAPGAQENLAKWGRAGTLIGETDRRRVPPLRLHFKPSSLKPSSLKPSSLKPSSLKPSSLNPS